MTNNKNEVENHLFSKIELCDEINDRILSNQQEIQDVLKHSNFVKTDDLINNGSQEDKDTFFELCADNLFLESILKLLKPKVKKSKTEVQNNVENVVIETPLKLKKTKKNNK